MAADGTPAGKQESVLSGFSFFSPWCARPWIVLKRLVRDVKLAARVLY